MTQNDIIMLESAVEYYNTVNSRFVLIKFNREIEINTGVFWNIHRTVGSSCSRYQI